VTITDQFQALFTGRTDAYGLEKGEVVKAPLTKAHYAYHLQGEGQGIGVFPLRDDNTVMFAAIDLDAPDFEMGFRLADVLPGQAWVEKTRSGNVHVWVFFTEPIEAYLARGVLRAALEAMGIPKTEVFPKQDTTQFVQFGNYINLPWHGGNRPILTDADAHGFWLPDRWIETAMDRRIPPRMWRSYASALGIRAPEERANAAEFGDRAYLHPCAIKIYNERESHPLSEGVRDVVLFNFAKQLLNWREMTEDEAWEMVQEVNAASLPPLPEAEVRRLFRNAATRGYTSTGCDDPLMADYIEPDCPIARNA
jgi:hypothetical protein